METDSETYRQTDFKPTNGRMDGKNGWKEGWMDS
jgi:hypothetical protein